MKLSALIKHTPIKGQMGSMDVEITGVSIDSRTVKKNFVFIAITGENIDGHNFIHKAIQKGAVAVIHEKPIPNFQDNVSYILSGDTRNTLAHVANTWFDNPSKKDVGLRYYRHKWKNDYKLFFSTSVKVRRFA